MERPPSYSTTQTSMPPSPGCKLTGLGRLCTRWQTVVAAALLLSTAIAGQDTPVSFRASDSLVVDFANDRGRIIGDAQVSLGDVTVAAHMVEILFDAEELHARGVRTDSGLVGAPTFTQGVESLTGISLAYNMATSQGRAVGARTAFEEGFIQAGVAKVKKDSSIYIRAGLYTTCNCGPDETPSYSLRARKMKIVDRRWVYTGPIQLFIFNIPTPFWLPFGFLPYQEGRRSGLLAPEYGEDERGFYLRNWGYYWAISEYIDAQMRLGAWSRGSWQVNPSFRYNRRYQYRGNVNIDFLRERSGEREDPDAQLRRNLSIRWSHNQTLSPTSRLTASVNLSSSSYLRSISEQYNDNVRQSVGSSVQYSRRMRRGQSFSINLRHNQVLSTGHTNLALPEMSFSQGTKTPFRRKGSLRRQRIYERFQFSLSSRLTNRFNFRPLTDEELIARGDTLADGRPIEISWYEALFDQERYERATGRQDNRINLRATHRVPVSVPFAINRLPLIGAFRLNVSPNANYLEEWYLQTERQVADSTGRTMRRQIPGFFSVRQFNTGVSASTTFYGVFPVAVGRYQGLRHTVRPRLGYTYRPDFFSDSWGYSRTLTDDKGVPVVGANDAIRRYSIVPGISGGQQRAVSFGVNNVFETKHVVTDSTGEQQSRVMKLFNVNVASSYNFAADSLNVAPVRISARTNILGKMNINASSTLSLYRLNETGTREINTFIFTPRRLAFARLTQLNVRGSFRLQSSRQRASTAPTPQRIPPIDSFGSTGMGLSDPFTARQFQDGAFADWSVNVSFGYLISKRTSQLTRRATVNTAFDFNVTSTWRVRGQTGFDFESSKLVTTTLNIAKEFECWQMGFRWIPFGAFQSWGFDLHVKSGRLREFLRIQQPKVDRRRGLGGSSLPIR